MAAQFPVLSRRVTIDASNRAIRMIENGVPQTVLVALGTYAIRDDGVPGEDLLRAIEDALDSATGGTNTYSLFLELDTDPANPVATITVDRQTGANAYMLLWGDAPTTFDGRLLGFVFNTANDTSPKVSTRAPEAIWVANSVVKSIEPVPAYVRKSGRTKGRAFHAVSRTDEVRDRLWRQDWIDGRRMNVEEQATGFEANALSTFIDSLADGGTFEFHLAEPSTGSLVGSLSSATLLGEYHFSDDFYPEERTGFATRHSEGLSLYSFEGYLFPLIS